MAKKNCNYQHEPSGMAAKICSFCWKTVITLKIMLGFIPGNFILHIVSAIVQRHFVSLRSVLIIYDANNTSTMGTSYLEGVTEGVKMLADQNKIFFSWINMALLETDDEFQEILARNAEIGTEGYISILYETSMFISAKYNCTQFSVLRQRDRIFLMLSATETPAEVLTMKELYLYPQHLLVVSKNESNLEFWTQKYIGETKNNQPVLLNTFYSNNLKHDIESLYPDKLQNLMGRRLTVASITYVPYTECYIEGQGRGNVRGLKSNTLDVYYGGTEAQLMLEFCRRKHCKLAVESYGPDRWGGIYKNGSSDGMIGSTYRKETEIAIGCIYNWFNDNFDVSQNIAKSSVTLLTPAPCPLQPYQAIVMPFSNMVWVFIFVAIVISSMMFHLLNKHELVPRNRLKWKRNSFVASSLYVAAIFFQQSYTSEKVQKRAVRVCIGCLLIATFILENSYTGKLKSLLTVPQYTEPIDTVLKFVKTDLKWGGPAEIWAATIAESNIPHEQTLFAKFERRSRSELRNLTFTRSYGLGIERLHSGLYSFGDYIKPDALTNLIVLKDNIYFDYTRIISIRGWPLMRSLNQFIQRTLEHGLWNAWEKEYVRKYLNPKAEDMIINLGASHRNIPVPTILNLSHVSGIFLILIFGYIMGLASFCCEIFTNYFNN